MKDDLPHDHRDTHKSPDEIQQDIEDSRRRRLLLYTLAAAAVVAVGAAIWRFTDGDIKMTAIIMVGLVLSGLSLLMRLNTMTRDTRGVPLARVVRNVVVAAAILGTIWYFYGRGIDRILE